MTDWRAVARQAAVRHGINPVLFVRQIGAESNFDPRAGSPAGAQGIAQIMPATARGWGVDPWKPAEALDAAARAMAKYQRSYGSYRDALVAYNAGPGRVGKPLYDETRTYIDRIMGGKGEDAWGTSTPTAATPGGATDVAAVGMDPRRAAAVTTVFDRSGNPRMRALLERAIAAQSTSVSNATGAGSSPTGAVDSTPVGPAGAGPGNSWKSLRDWTVRYAGADVQGDFQTTGGQHTAGSNHYKGTAIDLGDATVKDAQFRRIATFARKYPHLFTELYWAPLGWHIKNGRIYKGVGAEGHGDHMHLAVPGARR